MFRKILFSAFFITLFFTTVSVNALSSAEQKKVESMVAKYESTIEKNGEESREQTITSLEKIIAILQAVVTKLKGEVQPEASKQEVVKNEQPKTKNPQWSIRVVDGAIVIEWTSTKDSQTYKYEDTYTITAGEYNIDWRVEWWFVRLSSYKEWWTDYDSCWFYISNSSDWKWKPRSGNNIEHRTKDYEWTCSVRVETRETWTKRKFVITKID